MQNCVLVGYDKLLFRVLYVPTIIAPLLDLTPPKIGKKSVSSVAWENITGYVEVTATSR